MESKKLSSKQIFRTLMFQYHLNNRLPLQLLSEVVSNLYYPLDTVGIARTKYKNLLNVYMKEYNNRQKYYTESQFVKFMEDLKKYSNKDYITKIAQRIFYRYADRGENIIDQIGFHKLATSFKIDPKQIDNFFLTTADRKNQITLEKFTSYMNTLYEVHEN